MATNNIQNVNLDVISQRTLETLLPLLAPVRAMAADFSPDIMNEGESVKTRIVPRGTASDFSNGFVASDANTTPVVINLSSQKGYGVGFSDAEISKSSIDLNRIFVGPAANAVATAMMSDLFSNVKTSNYSLTPAVVTAANFDSDVVADLAQQLTNANVPKTGRVLMLNPTYYGALAKDSSIKLAYAFGTPEVIQQNIIRNVHGFDIYESTIIPDNGEHTAGFACWNEALCIAARQPALPQNWYGQVANVIDPQSNLPLQFRFWYEGKDQKHYLSVQALWGTSVGNTGALIPIRSSSDEESSSSGE